MCVRKGRPKRASNGGKNMKKTKKEMFMVIVNETQNEEVKAFCLREIELLDKKSSRKSNSLSKTQRENLLFKNLIIEVLDDEPRTIKEIQGLNESLNELSSQKMSALLKQLVESGNVERITDKRQTKFKRAE